MKYTNHISTKVTSQNQPIPGSTQVPNYGGGYGWNVTDEQLLERFLILGTEGGSYYVNEQTLTVEAATAVSRCLDADPIKTVDTIVSVSYSGLAVKNDPAIFALAMAAGHKNPDCRNYALSKLQDVCRIGTHLFQFVDAVEHFRGWGKGLRRAVGNWYNQKEAKDLAYQVTKYQQRGGWSHRDLLRLSHAAPSSELHQAVMRYVVKGAERTVDYPVSAVPTDLQIIWAVETLKSTKDMKQVCRLIQDYNLTHEMVPNEWKNSPEVWDALLQRMPVTATIRNLGKMSNVGLLKPLSDAARLVRDRVTDQFVLQKGRVHPLTILGAQMTYQQGHGVKGKLTWSPVPTVVEVLETGFYLSFGVIQPSGKKFLLGIDISGSMQSTPNMYGYYGNMFQGLDTTQPGLGGVPGLNPAMASAVMAMVTARTESNYHIMGFAHTFRDLGITASDRLESAMRKVQGNFGSTDCSLPMETAISNKWDVDTFVVYTDCETNTGRRHPSQALKAYNQQMGKQSKLIVCAMIASRNTIAEPGNPLMLDIVGFSTDTPNIISSF